MIFLERGGVTPDTADKDGGTPLLWVARIECEGIVEILLEREDVTPTLRTKTVELLSRGLPNKDTLA